MSDDDGELTTPENKIDVPVLTRRQSRSSFFSFNANPFSHLIGKGDQAKDSVVWYLITRMVRLSALVVVVLFGVDIFYNKGTNCLSILKETWSVFAPIITLSMGYLFGKKERGKSDDE
ncbi:hypothetical protein [Pseudomonas coronafaciens]|uniref:hypothetical protein n=1 Tax=Pseudomonas coronafaciens TaxID=53409 RepID=UPI00192E3935|nr:hypothetical protein [Pseudomonas coronafaciens]